MKVSVGQICLCFWLFCHLSLRLSELTLWTQKETQAWYELLLAPAQTPRKLVPHSKRKFSRNESEKRDIKEDVQLLSRLGLPFELLFWYFDTLMLGHLLSPTPSLPWRSPYSLLNRFLFLASLCLSVCLPPLPPLTHKHRGFYFTAYLLPKFFLMRERWDSNRPRYA